MSIFIYAASTDYDYQAELETWGWKEYGYHDGLCNWASPSGGANIKRALDALGLNAFSKDDGGDNVCYTVTHQVRDSRNDKGELLHVNQQVYKVNGKDYRVRIPKLFNMLY